MSEVCAGYMEERDKRKRWEIRRSRGILRELSLLFLLVIMSGGWIIRAGEEKNYLISAVPDTVSETDWTPVPVQPQRRTIRLDGMGIAAGFFRESEDSYYAGPLGTFKKEEGEICVVLDPGHGGRDDGCVRGGVREKELNLSIALQVQEHLQALGYQVLLTRDQDVSQSLGERVQTAREAQADIYVSIHQNSSELSKVNGLEIYYSAQNAGGDSSRLAGLIYGSALQNTGAKARSVFEWEEILVVRESQMPACLIETGFLTNASERRRLTDPSYQERLAEGIAEGIDQYFHPRTLCLTFTEDIQTDKINTALSFLKEQNIKAVFFGTAELADTHPEMLSRIIEEGHQIGIYGTWADYRAVYADADHYLEDLKESYGKIKEAADASPKLFASMEDLGGMQKEAISHDLEEELKIKGMVPYDWTPRL